MTKHKLPHIKPVKAKGKEYLYFRTGRTGADGKEILKRLPSKDDAGFGASYASFLAGRSRQTATHELTVTAFCDLWEKSQKYRAYKPGTRKIYGYSIDYFKSKLPTAPAGLLERQDIARLIDGRADQPGAANSLLRTINSLYKWGRKRGHVSNDPGREVEELDVGEHQPWPEHILAAALEADDGRVRLGTHLLYYLGQRIEDTVQLRWTDIKPPTDEGEPPRIALVQQKTGRELSIPLHSDLQAELGRWRDRIGYIIPGAKAGQALHQHTLRTSLQAFAAEQGAKVVPHGLRKNAVNTLLEAGCSAAETASITGQSLQMVEHYAKGRAQGKLASAAILRWEAKR